MKKKSLDELRAAAYGAWNAHVRDMRTDPTYARVGSARLGPNSG